MSIHDQKVVITLNPFQKLAAVRRFAKGDNTMDGYYNWAHNPSVRNDQRAIVRALRKYPRDEWCQSIVSRNLTVDQANDVIRCLNRMYLAQGYKLLQNELLA